MRQQNDIWRLAAGFLRRQGFGIAILACAAIAFAFPQCFRTWGGVKLMSLVVPAIQIIMFGMGTTLSPGDFARVAKRPWAVATGVFLQFIVMPVVGFLLAKTFGFSGELAAQCGFKDRCEPGLVFLSLNLGDDFSALVVRAAELSAL